MLRLTLAKIEEGNIGNAKLKIALEYLLCMRGRGDWEFGPQGLINLLHGMEDLMIMMP